MMDGLGRSAHIMPKQFEGLPAFVIPYGIEHIASTGLDLWLGALSYGFAVELIVFRLRSDNFWFVP